MELKASHQGGTTSHQGVSIAPLWNWKAATTGATWSVSGFNRTFMELKGIVAVVIDESLQFQSHLYGIESCLQPREGLRRLVSIAPLWNWKISSQLHRNACHSFNRTFMELKVKMFEPVLEEKSFQSHLYGIERKFGHDQCWNNAVSIAPLWNWKVDGTPVVVGYLLFQSHLYGIERYAVSRCNGFNVVSIAPLWNWKWQGAVFLEVERKFQSHLYGIESRDWLEQQHLERVSIAPLWNWKRWWAWWTSASTRFNRTFMELKVGSSFFAHTATFRFNRTFMELKDTFRLWTRNKHQCFNRTFMELKVEYIGGVQRRREFQSHLYGIERS